ncbi:MAG: hypothetical protein WAV51_03155 [Microgenomates group bacterium]
MSARIPTIVGVVVYFFFFRIPISFAVSGVVFTPLEIDSASPIIGDTFAVQATASGGMTGAVYYLKCRIGQTSSSLTEGQTYNTTTEKWLDDTSAWIDMPQVMIQNDGSWRGALPCRIKTSAVDEIKLLFLRGCLQVNDACGTSFQSANYLSFSPILPTATMAPTVTPTVTPTPAKGPTNTPAVSTVLITTPTPINPSSKPTSFVQILSQVTVVDEMAPSGTVLGQTNETQKNASGSMDMLSEKRPYIIALLFVGIGLSLLAAVSVIKIRYTKDI